MVKNTRRRRGRQPEVEEEHVEEQKTPMMVEKVSIVSRNEVVDGHEQEYDLEVSHFVHDNLAYVRVQAEQKRTLAEYENVTVSISVSIPCYKEEVEAVIAEAGELVGDRLNQELDFYLEGTDDAEKEED